jgi:hypothetical protein
MSVDSLPVQFVLTVFIVLYVIAGFGIALNGDTPSDAVEFMKTQRLLDDNEKVDN